MDKTNRRRRQLYGLLGDLPPRRRKVAARKVGEERRGACVVERLVLDLNGIEPVPAYFVRPVEDAGPRPTVLFNHSHGGNYERGKNELLRSCEYLSMPTLRAGALEALYDGRDQRADRPAAAPGAGGELRPPDAAGGA